MRNSNFHIAFVCALVVATVMSCQKEDNLDKVESTFLKIYSSETELIARGAMELPNGDLVLLGCSYELNAYGTRRSEVACYSSLGELKWNRTVPQEIHALWAGEVLKNGNIILAGFDTIPSSPNIGLVEMNPHGEVLNVKTIYNNIGSNTGGQSSSTGRDNRLALNVLSDGSILLSVNELDNLIYEYLRLIMLDEGLNIIRSKTYSDSSGDLIWAGDYPFVVDELESGSIIVNPGIQEFPAVPDSNGLSFRDSLRYSFREIQLPELNIDSSWVYEVKSDVSEYNSFIYKSNGFFMARSYGEIEEEYSLRNMETHYSNERPSIYRLGDNGEEIQTLPELPRNSYFSKLEHTSDGGFIALGNGNLNEAITSSTSRVILGKFSRTGRLEWTRVINTGIPIFGHSIVENSRGYLVSASNFSMGNRFQIILIQLNQNGTL